MPLLKLSPGQVLRQRVFKALAGLITHAVRVLSAVFGGRPRPLPAKLPTRTVGDTRLSTSTEELEAALRELSAAAALWAVWAMQ